MSPPPDTCIDKISFGERSFDSGRPARLRCRPPNANCRHMAPICGRCADWGRPTSVGASAPLAVLFALSKVRPPSRRQSVTLRMDQINAFLRQTAKTNNRFSLQHVVASFCEVFCAASMLLAILKQPLHEQIDTPRTYRLEQLPRALPWAQVRALLRSIDRAQPDGVHATSPCSTLLPATDCAAVSWCV